MKLATNTATEVAAPEPAPVETPRRRRPWAALSVRNIGAVYVLIAIIIVFSIWASSTFPTIATVRQILNGNAVTALIGLSLVVPLCARVFDLSVAYTATLSGVLTAYLIAHGMSLVLAIVIGLLAALGMGVMNGLIVVVAGIDSFIGTLATGSVVQAIVSLITNNIAITSNRLNGGFSKIAQNSIGQITLPVFYVIVVALALWVLLEHTATGRRLYATGFNPDSARLARVKIKRLRFGALLTSALISGGAGIVLMSTIGSGDPAAGSPYLLSAFAVAFVGATQLHAGRFNSWGTVIAVLMIGTGDVGLGLVSAPTWTTELFQGVVLIAALAVTGQVRRVARAGLVRRRWRPSTAWLAAVRGSTLKVPHADTLLPVSAESRTAEGSRRRWSWSAIGMRNIGAIYVLIAIIIVFSIWAPSTFPTIATVRQILNGNAVTALIGLSLVVPLTARVFDLSVAYTATLSGVLTAYLIAHGTSLVLAIVIGLLAGLGMGVMNGLVVVVFGIDSFIGTLATGSVVQAIVSLITNNIAITSNRLNGGFSKLAQNSIGQITLPVFYVIAVALVLWFVLQRTATGRRLYATGFNAESSRLTRVRVKRLRFGALLASSFISAGAGIVLMSTIGSGDPAAGSPYLLSAFAVAFLGATQLRAGRFNAWGTVIAVLLIGTGDVGLGLVSAPTWTTELFQGLVLIAALAVTGRERLAARAGTNRRLWRRGPVGRRAAPDLVEGSTS